ncbi:hypothetical protein HMPREF0629_01410 [Peptoniphilus sp. oral taxon 386 str. F0131]|nr:hypothetical protein HMPREF0629_01410 [Peptoniphilus sp. oral taxon 386 str. F0131]
MVVGTCKIKLRLFSPNSLKEKRKIIKSLIERLKNKFNISIAEVEDNDLWQSSVIGIAVVSNDSIFADEVINKVLNFIENFNDVEIIECDIEML